MRKPGAPSYYANVEGSSRVFSLSDNLLRPLEAELHAQRVMGFKPVDAEGVLFAWPDRPLALERKHPPAGSGSTWAPAPGFDPTGFAVDQTDTIVTALSELKTPRFLQYEGKFHEQLSGFDHSRLVVTARQGAGKPVWQTLRVGNSLNEAAFAATNTFAAEGPVFVIPAEAIKGFLESTASRPAGRPEDVFARGRPSSQPRGAEAALMMEGRAGLAW